MRVRLLQPTRSGQGGDDPSASSLGLLFYEGCSLGLRSSLRKDGEHVSYRYIQGESRREGLVSISDSGGFSVHVSIDSARGFFCCNLLPIWQTPVSASTDRPGPRHRAFLGVSSDGCWESQFLLRFGYD